jgi:hypothetical protein
MPREVAVGSAGLESSERTETRDQKPETFSYGTGSFPPFAHGWHSDDRPAVSTNPFGLP